LIPGKKRQEVVWACHSRHWSQMLQTGPRGVEEMAVCP
jgi:hypothetical protein